MNLAKIVIVNAVAVENDSESTFLYVFNLSGLVCSKASVPRWTWVRSIHTYMGCVHTWVGNLGCVGPYMGWVVLGRIFRISCWLG